MTCHIAVERGRWPLRSSTKGRNGRRIRHWQGPHRQQRQSP